MEKRFCGKCGSQLDSQTGLCPVCDAKAINKSHKNNNGIIIAILVLIVLLLFGGVFYALKTDLFHFSSNNNETKTSTVITTSQDSQEEVINTENDETQTTTEATTPTTTQNTTMDTNDDYLFPSDTELLTKEYLDTKSKNEIDLIRNEIYARHGYIFKKEEYYNYFIQKNWYRPTEADMDKAYNNFNKTEKKNIDILVEYQGLN